MIIGQHEYVYFQRERFKEEELNQLLIATESPQIEDAIEALKQAGRTIIGIKLKKADTWEIKLMASRNEIPQQLPKQLSLTINVPTTT